MSGAAPLLPYIPSWHGWRKLPAFNAVVEKCLPGVGIKIAMSNIMLLVLEQFVT
jgi:hypothetical protein